MDSLHAQEAPLRRLHRCFHPLEYPSRCHRSAELRDVRSIFQTHTIFYCIEKLIKIYECRKHEEYRR